MSTTADDQRPTMRTWGVRGFVVGLAVALPATIFSWFSPVGEALHPFLVPDFEAFHPLSRLEQTWPGAGNFLLAFLLNGVIYAAVGAALGAARSSLRDR